MPRTCFVSSRKAGLFLKSSRISAVFLKPMNSEWLIPVRCAGVCNRCVSTLSTNRIYPSIPGVDHIIQVGHRGGGGGDTARSRSQYRSVRLFGGDRVRPARRLHAAPEHRIDCRPDPTRLGLSWPEPTWPGLPDPWPVPTRSVLSLPGLTRLVPLRSQRAPAGPGPTPVFWPVRCRCRRYIDFVRTFVSVPATTVRRRWIRPPSAVRPAPPPTALRRPPSVRPAACNDRRPGAPSHRARFGHSGGQVVPRATPAPPPSARARRDQSSHTKHHRAPDPARPLAGKLSPAEARRIPVVAVTSRAARCRRATCAGSISFPPLSAHSGTGRPGARRHTPASAVSGAQSGPQRGTPGDSSGAPER